MSKSTSAAGDGDVVPSFCRLSKPRLGCMVRPKRGHDHEGAVRQHTVVMSNLTREHLAGNGARAAVPCDQ
jgi:hypothetical protein